MKNSGIIYFSAITTLILCFSFISDAKVGLPSILGDNMVLQRNTEVNLWGSADAGKTVTVETSWNGKKYRTKSDDNGKWSLKVATGEAGGPYSIIISDGEKLVLENILLGEEPNAEMPAYLLYFFRILQPMYLNPVHGARLEIRQYVFYGVTVMVFRSGWSIRTQVQVRRGLASSDIVQFFRQKIVLCHNLAYRKCTNIGFSC